MSFGVQLPKSSLIGFQFFFGLSISLLGLVAGVCTYFYLSMSAGMSVMDTASSRLSMRPSVVVASGKQVLGLPVVDTQRMGTQGISERTIAEQVAGARVTKAHVSGTIAQRIPKGFRAVSIAVDVRSSVEQLVAPGAKVDLVWTVIGAEQNSVKVIVQGAEVLSVADSVTLLVSEEDAKKVHYASTTGVLSLSLRGDEEAALGATKTTGATQTAATLDQMLAINGYRNRPQAQVVFNDAEGKSRKLVVVNNELQDAATDR